MNEIIKLKDIATEINAEQIRIVEACRASVQHAIRAGELLIQAKSMIKHGEWCKWLQDNCTFSERTAQAYMKLAKDFPKLEDSKAKTVADLPLRKALSLLAEPRESIPPLRMLNLKAGCQLSTNTRDDKLVFISPSAKYPGSFYVECLHTENGTAEGWAHPVLSEYVTICLDHLCIPPEIPWSRDKNFEPIDKPIFMKERAYEQFEECINLGIMPDINDHYPATEVKLW